MVNITNGLLMLLSFVQHQSEFDRKVKFTELDNAIGQIDISMKDFPATPNDKLNEARSLNEAAQLSYHQSVSPLVGWCNVAINNFGILIPHIKDGSLSNQNKDFIFLLIDNTLHEGLEKTAQSIVLLNDVQRKSSRVVNLFYSIKHDVYNDYGKQKVNLDAQMQDLKETQSTYNTLSYIPIVNVFSYIADKAGRNEEKRHLLRENILNIENKLKRIIENIMVATEISKTGVNPNLERDDTNLSSLRGKTYGADNTKNFLKLDFLPLRTRYADILQELTNQCRDYNLWHEARN